MKLYLLFESLKNMKILFTILILFCIQVISIPVASIPFEAEAQGSENRNDSTVLFGVSSSTFEKINRNDASAALKAWASTVIKEQDLKVKGEVTLIDSFDSLYEALHNDSLDAVTLTVGEYMRIGVKSEVVMLTAREDGFHIRYAIVVNRKSAITDFAGLQGRKIIINEGPSSMVLARLWLASLFADDVTGHKRRMPPDLTAVDNPSKAILQVYFGQAHAAIVTIDAFELACELNPQLRKDITVLSASPPFVTSFFIFRPGWKGVTRERMEAAIMALHTTPGGRQVLTVFQSSKMERHPASILDSTIQFIEKYQHLPENPLYRGVQP